MHPAKTIEVDIREFMERPEEFAANLRGTNDEMLLVAKGKPSLVALDPKAYYQMQSELEKARAYEGVKRGWEAVQRGDVIPIEDAIAQWRKQFPSLYEE